VSRTAGARNPFPASCPVCSGRRLGRVGLDQYFCWDCYAQFTAATNRQRVWEIADDGSLVPHAAFSALKGDTGRGEPLAEDLEARR